MQEQDGLLDLVKYRKKKQTIAEDQVQQLYSDAFDFALKETNIREKVRAKMIFSKRFNLSEPSLVSDEAERLFQQWFLFDYKTIQGRTLFFQYLQSKPLTEPIKMLGALVLTAALEPVILNSFSLEENEVRLRCHNVFQDEEEDVKMNSASHSELLIGSVYFVRKVPLITEQWIIGPLFLVESMDNVSNLLNHYRQMNQETGVLWRTFLKEESPHYVLSSHL